MNLSTNSKHSYTICSDGGDGSSPNFMILVLAHLVLGPNLEASASKMANADEMSLAFRFVAKMAASSAYSRYGPSWIPAIMALAFFIR